MKSLTGYYHEKNTTYLHVSMICCARKKKEKMETAGHTLKERKAGRGGEGRGGGRGEQTVKSARITMRVNKKWAAQEAGNQY